MARAAVSQEMEAPPEADRLDGAPHPRHTTCLHGHGAAEAELQRGFAGGRMHHAWLVTGPVGIGKATLAWRLARYLLAAPADRASGAGPLDVRAESASARLVAQLSHPGLLLVRRPYDTKAKRHMASITVDEVRRLRGFLGHTVDETGWRVVIVDAADDLNVSAANALLKSLEEPPARTVFVLVSAEPGRLLVTIRSRCRHLPLSPLPPADLQAATAAALAAGGGDAVADADWPHLYAIARGSVRRAITLVRGNGLALQTQIERIVGLLPKVDWPSVHSLADEMASAAGEPRFEAFVELLMDHIAGLVRAAATGDGTSAGGLLAARMATGASQAAWAEAWAQIVGAKADLDALNLDRRAFVLDTVARLEKLAGARG